MPQKSSYTVEPYTGGGSGYSVEPYQSLQKAQQKRAIEPTWLQSGIGTALSVLPAVGGGLLGSGLPVLGNIALGGLGAGLGNTMRQYYEYTQGLRPGGFNPWELGTETALGAVPGGLLFKGPAKGAEAAVLSKYAKSLPWKGAVEGAVVNAAGTPFQNWAQTGSFDAPASAYLGNAASGAAFGAGGGYLFGTRPLNKQIAGMTPPPPVTATPQAPVAAHVPTPAQPMRDLQGSFNFEPAPRQQDIFAPHGPAQMEMPTPFDQRFEQTPAGWVSREGVPETQMVKPGFMEGPEIGPYGLGDGQQRLPFESDYKSHIDEETGETIVDQFEGQQDLGLNLQNPPDPDVYYSAFGGAEDVSGDHIIQIEKPTAEGNALLRQQGYESYGYNPDTGKVQMIKRAKSNSPVPPTPVSQAPASTTPVPQAPTAQTPGQKLRWGMDGTVRVKNPSAKFVQGMVKQGAEIVGEIQDGVVTFKRAVPKTVNEGAPDEPVFQRTGDEGGGGDIDARLVQEATERVRARTGQDPTMPELAQEVDRIRAERGPQFGESTGRVTPFVTPKRQVYEIAEELRNHLTTEIPDDPRIETLYTEAERTIMDETDPAIIRDNLNQLEQYAQQPGNTPDETEFLGSLRDVALDKLRQSGTLDFAPPNIPRRPPIQDIDIEQNPFDTPNEQVIPLGPRPVTPNDVQMQGLPEGQLDLPMLGMRNRLENISNVQPPEGPVDLGPQPTQLSMGPPIAGAGGPPVGTMPGRRGWMSDEPAFARLEGGGYKASMNVRRGVENITKDYTSPLPGIQAREGLQNALDAADKLGTGGDVKIRLDDDAQTIEIYDNGGGMDDATIGDKLFEAFATGKEGEEGATGGKGIGSASYIYGGKNFEIESIADDLHDVIDHDTGVLIRKADGKRYRITTSGTPEEFIVGNQNNYSRTEVKKDTPTGTTIKVQLKDDHDIYDARKMVQNIVENSRNRSSRITVDEYGYPTKNIPLKDVQTSKDIPEHRIPSSKGDKLIGDFTTTNRNSKVEVLIPRNVEGTFDRIQIHYLNNGMYQFTDEMHLGKMADGVPEKILIDIHPLVDDQDELYPFINTREDIKRDIREEVTKYVQENIAKPGLNRRKNRTQELYDSMSQVPVGGTTRKPVIYDPGNRLTPKEMEHLTKNPVVQQLIQLYDRTVGNILASTGRQKWMDRVEGVGLVLDPGMHGVHIPNPTTGKSTILINPFIRIEQGLDPKISAWKNTITNLHEGGHVGSEHGTPIQLKPQDLQDPRLGEFLSSYMNQLVEHGDIGWGSTGHGMDFAHRLGEVYAGFGVQNTFNVANELHTIFTGGNKSGGYSPEIQRLLQLYKESRGRAATTEDLLSGTGVKQANRRSTPEGSIPSNRPPDGDGTPPAPVEKKAGKLRQIYNLSRGLTTSLDLSAPLRQGLPMIFSKSYWKALGPMMKAGYSEEAFNLINNKIREHDNFALRLDDNGNTIQSHGEEAGVKLMDLAENLNRREEAHASQWAETGDFLGPLAGAYKATIGRGVRASNRAYTTFLNKLRSDSFNVLTEDAMKLHQIDPVNNKNPETDMVFAKTIADFVNTATGRGPLRGSFLGEKEHSLEQSSKLLTDVLFSPRLLASRMRMLSPGTYIMAEPFVRKQYLKAALSTGTAWMAVAGLAKAGGAEVSTDPNSSDFGKIKIGNTRIDPAGGFQQFIVAASRLLTGEYTSSATQRGFTLGEGYRAETRGDIAQRFASNKLHPVVKFGYDLAFASKRQPVNMLDRTAQMFVPLIVQDFMELAQEDPSLLPLLGPIGLGMGTQTYEKGETRGKFIAPEHDISFEGGPLQNLWQ